MYDRRDLSEVRRDRAQWLAKWETRCPKLCQWVEDNIEETLTFNRLPRQHHKRLKSINILERLNQEIKRRTPCGAHLSQRRELPAARPRARRRNTRKLAGVHANLNMEHLAEHKKEMLRKLEEPKAAVT